MSQPIHLPGFRPLGDAVETVVQARFSARAGNYRAALLAIRVARSYLAAAEAAIEATVPDVADELDAELDAEVEP